MNGLTELDHIGIACDDLGDAVERYRGLLGLEPVHRERILEQGVDEVLFAVGDSFIQLLGSLGPQTPIGRSLARRGPGLHHIAYRVDDIEVALADLRRDGFRLIDDHPRRGSRGTKIAFVHPRAAGGVLFELVEVPTG